MKKNQPSATSNGAFKIDKGVPIPDMHLRSGPIPRYPWRTMEIKDSFFVPNATRSMQTQASNNGRQLQRKFYAQKCTEHGVTGVRIWRVE